MKLTMTREALRDASRTAAAAVPGRTTLPALMNVLIEADADGVRFSATDLDSTIRQRAVAQVEETGSVAVPAGLLADLAAKLPAGEVKFTTTIDKATVVAGRSRFTLPVLPAGDFPVDVIPAASGEPWSITGEKLAAIAAIGFAVSTEETRPILNGVHLHTDGDDLIAVATNGHRLVVLRLHHDSPVALPLGEVIVHPRALRHAAKLFEGQVVSVRRGELRRSTLSFVGEHAELHTGLIEGPYPEYKRVFPPEFATGLKCNRKALLETLDRVKLAATDQTNRVHFHLNGALAMSARQPDGAEAHDEVTVEATGGEMLMDMSARYLSEALSFLGCEEIEWKWSAPNRASLLGPVGDDSARLLLMPIGQEK